MSRRWRILHLTAAVAETSGQYNEHCLPLLGERDLTICSFHPPAVEPPAELPSFHGGGTSLGYLRALRAAFADGREYDLIHAHSARAGVLFLLFGLTRPRELTRCVYTMQNSFLNYHLGNRILLAPIFASYRRVVTCSGAVLDSLPGFLRWLGGSRMRVVQNAVHTERVARAVDRAPKRSDESFVVACTGRVIEIKNPFTVVDAFTRAAEPNWKLRFIGEGNLREGVLADARSRRVDEQVEITGLIPRDAVFEAVGSADVFVSASRGEGLPVAVLEAMACGCPVILSDIAPHREVVGDAEFVPLVATEDSEGYARELRRFHAMSTAERAEIGAQCRKHVEERFGLRVMHSAYEQIYDEVCPENEPLTGASRRLA
jgi:glycosyltransferase involved in cell wall biosynthesis